MKRSIFLILFILLFKIGFTSTPRHLYHYPGFYYMDLLPFTTDQLKKFKSLGIKQVKVLQDNYDKIIYVFNDDGQLISHTVYRLKRKKEIKESQTLYNYDNSGNLITKKKAYEDVIICDSFVYDNRNRLIEEYQSCNYLKNNVINIEPYHCYFKLELKDSSNSESVYFEINSKSFYTINNENKVIKVVSSNRTDSVSIENINDSIRLEHYWYTEQYHSKFLLGQEISYKNENIQAATQYYMNGNTIFYQRTYSYNENNQCYLIEETLQNSLFNKKKQYIPNRWITFYNKYGLVEDALVMFKYEVREITKYIYHFD